jgi:ribosomal protein S18 acetylase RimI-like enzyme
MSGIVTRQTLTAEEIASIQRLAAACDEYEHLHIRILMSMLRNRPGTKTNDFLYYTDDSMLAGYLCLENFGEKEKELMAMVHPDYRRKGIFTALLARAKEVFASEGGKLFVLVCERASSSGQAVMKTLPVVLDHAEHEMLLGTFKPRNIFDDRLLFRRAMAWDTDKLIEILGEDIGEEQARKHVIKRLQEPTQRFYIATLGGQDLGCDEPVGTLRLEDLGRENELGIYGFVIRSEYRGRGYGRQMLEETIRAVQAEGQRGLMLDVDVDNANALGLYLSCGFEITTTYVYYDLEVA